MRLRICVEAEDEMEFRVEGTPAVRDEGVVRGKMLRLCSVSSLLGSVSAVSADHHRG